MVVAPAGTTVAGMIDPLRACAEIAESAGAWFHVDAAWGGAAIASDRQRARLAGIELADSITIDAHKWFATTMGCGMFIISQPWILSEAFDITTSFMPSVPNAADPYTTSVLWSRRFLGLRLFFNLAAAGWSGYAQHIERTLKLTDQMRVQLAALGWTIVNPGSLGVLCVVPPVPHRPVREIAEAIVSSGEAWIAAATFEGRDVIRISITNGQSNSDDIKALVGLLWRHAAVPGAQLNSPQPARQPRDMQQH
jgi:glutamate/tyrosine decarboxylase-like PLP-dependent enzyme